MKKKHHHKGGHRRNASAAAPASPSAPARPRASPRLRRAASPPWKTILAAVGGGAGGAALGGLIVNQKILSPEAAGIGLAGVGAATAYFADGTARVVGTSMAAAGAGQFALALMAKQALKGKQHDQQQPANQNQQQTQPVAANQNTQTQQQLAPPPAADTRQSYSGGVVTDLFRDAVTDLDMIEDEWRYGMREAREAAPRDAAEPIVIDLDEAEAA